MRVAAVTAKMPVTETAKVRIACPCWPEREPTIWSITRRAKKGTAMSRQAVIEISAERPTSVHRCRPSNEMIFQARDLSPAPPSSELSPTFATVHKVAPRFSSSHVQARKHKHLITKDLIPTSFRKTGVVQK
jgi:hypothetical protein